MLLRIEGATDVPASCLEFLKLLKKNNNREWFNTHKEEFSNQQVLMEGFADELLLLLNTHDLIETASGKKSLHRIYKDTRFSKDKIPYKTNWSGSFRRATKERRGGYSFHIEPGNTYVVGGFHLPSPPDLKIIRNDISFDSTPLRRILNSSSFIENFGTLRGAQLKTTPKGFDTNDEAIDLLRYKQFLLLRRFSDEDVLDASFAKEVDYTFKAMRPFFDYMSEVLTTDTNGLTI